MAVEWACEVNILTRYWNGPHRVRVTAGTPELAARRAVAKGRRAMATRGRIQEVKVALRRLLPVAPA